MKIREDQIVKKILMEIDVMNNLIVNYTQELFLADEKTKRAMHDTY